MLNPRIYSTTTIGIGPQSKPSLLQHTSSHVIKEPVTAFPAQLQALKCTPCGSGQPRRREGW